MKKKKEQFYWLVTHQDYEVDCTIVDQNSDCLCQAFTYLGLPVFLTKKKALEYANNNQIIIKIKIIKAK